jgi:hypothetical protein
MRTSWVILAAAALPAAANEVTFYKDVAPVLQLRCQECHRAGEAAPMPLLTYSDARPWAKAIRAAVLSKKMPPWHADPGVGHFINDRSLSAAEIATLVRWADTGAPEGNPKDAPPPRRFADGWTIGQPDLVIEMPEEYKVPASGTIEYTYFIVPSGFTADKWVEKIEVRPGARSVVHHIVVMARPPESAYLKNAPKRTAYVPPKRPSPGERPPDQGKGQFEGLQTAMMEVISTYVPGGLAYDTRAGQARLIKAGSDIIFQMHYTANGKESVDRSRLGFVFAKEPPRERVVNTFISNRMLRIPAGAGDHKVEARVTTYEDATLQSLFPHMHLRGKAFEYVAKYPTGETQVLLRVPRYDFNWQITYFLKNPIRLPKGTEITATAWYDNSPNNKFNPDPSGDVFWGDQSWEEMLAGFADLVIPVDVNPLDIARPKPPATTRAGAE